MLSVRSRKTKTDGRDEQRLCLAGGSSLSSLGRFFFLSFFFFVDDDSGFSGGAMCDAATHSLFIFHEKDASYRESGKRGTNANKKLKATRTSVKFILRFSVMLSL